VCAGAGGAAPSASSAAPEDGDGGADWVRIEGTKRASISTFKGGLYVDLREW
jgi:hypothetical protein